MLYSGDCHSYIFWNQLTRIFRVTNGSTWGLPLYFSLKANDVFILFWKNKNNLYFHCSSVLSQVSIFWSIFHVPEM